MNKKFQKNLPNVFNNEVSKQFYDATADQLFSSANTEDLDAYIGRRVSGSFDPLNDFYSPQINKDRTWYQLEPVISSKNKLSGNYENIVFYKDFLNYLRVHGSLVNQQNKLFDGNFYSFSTPIDVDKFINYQLYYWVNELPDPISVSGVSDKFIIDNIINSKNFSFSDYSELFSSSDYYFVKLEDGILLQFPDSENFNDVYFVSGVGNRISLVSTKSPVIPDSGKIEDPDYFTISRGAKDRNLWSRTNRWIRVSAIKTMMTVNKKPFPASSIRASRPIIEYSSSIQRFNTYDSYVTDIRYFSDLSYDEVITMTKDDFESKYGEVAEDSNNYLVIINDRDVYDVIIDGESILLEEVESLKNKAGQCQIINANSELNGYFVSNYNGWNIESVQKNRVNLSPLFMLYDVDGVPLNDKSKYPESTFNGSKIFSYSIDDDNPIVDFNLGIQIRYKDTSQVSDIIFENNLNTDRVSYISGDRLSEIRGFYFYYDTDKKSHFNEWMLSSKEYKHKVIKKYAAIDSNDNQIELNVKPSQAIKVKKKGITLEDYEFTILEKEKPIVIIEEVEENDDIEIEFVTEDTMDDLFEEYYEVSKLIDSNTLYENVGYISYGELTPHMISIIENQSDYDGRSPISESNNYRYIYKDLSLGNTIIQPVTSLAKAMMFSTNENISINDSIDFNKKEYEIFKKKLISMSSSANYLIESNYSSYAYGIILDVCGLISSSNSLNESFKYTDMIPLSEPEEIKYVSPETLNHTYSLGETNTYRFYEIANFSKFSNIKVTNENLDVELRDDIDYVISDKGISFIDDDPSYYNNGDKILIELENTSIRIKNKKINQEIRCHLYKVSDFSLRYKKQKTMLDNHDYELLINDDNIELVLSSDHVLEDQIAVNLYYSVKKSHIPATPAKLGILPSYKPEMLITDVFSEPRSVIIGHDGSINLTFTQYTQEEIDEINGTESNIKTIFSKYDIRDLILYEFEKHVYSGIDKRFKNLVKDVSVHKLVSNPLSNNYAEYIDFIEAYRQDFLRWTTKNKLDYRINSTTTTNWKTWNYSNFNKVMWNGSTLYESDENLKGHYRGIFLEYYGTCEPNKPWEMLGFTQMPSWWISTHLTDDGFSGYGSDFSDHNTAMWADIEHGIIRRGYNKGHHSNLERKGLCGSKYISDLNAYDGNKLMSVYDGPSLSSTRNLIPVNPDNVLKTVSEIFSLGNIDKPSSKNWEVGDMGPVEFSWYSSSEAKFDVCKALFELRPADFSEMCFDTSNLSKFSNQYYNIDTNNRIITDDYEVHSENDKKVYGYQTWISDYVSGNNLPVSDTFGDVVRGLSLNLGHKLGGFTDSDTTRIFLQNVTEMDSDSLLIPVDNYQVIYSNTLTGKQLKMSGVIISSKGNGKYEVLGYDTLDPWFNFYPRNTMRSGARVSVGGVPVNFREFSFDESYQAGEYIRYSGKYYQAKVDVISSTFDSDEWEKIANLPDLGGVDVIYYPERVKEVSKIEYGTVFSNIQDLYDFLIGYGAYLEDNGWVYEEMDESGNPVNWKNSAYVALVWTLSNWGEGNTLTVCPSSSRLKNTYSHGYPIKVENTHKGIYNILDRYGYPIDVDQTNIVRGDEYITVESNNIDDGIYFINLIFAESEHVIVFDNDTDFSDTIYNPVFSSRQPRLKIQTKRTVGWNGTHNASGFLINQNKLIKNPESLAETIKTLYSDTNLDSDTLSEAAKKIIGFQEREYLTSLNLSKRTQYQLYKGMIPHKGTMNAVNKIFRQKNLATDDNLKTIEEWAIQVANYGTVKNKISYVFSSKYSLVNNDPQVYTIINKISRYDSIESILILSSVDIYKDAPTISVSEPTGEGTDNRVAKLKSTIDNNGKLTSIEVIDSGKGYIEEPEITISNDSIILSNGGDLIKPILKRLVSEPKSDNNIVIDINNKADVFETSDLTLIDDNVPYLSSDTLALPHAGYVSFNEVDFYTFDNLDILWDSTKKPSSTSSIWKANTDNGAWAVMSMYEMEYDVSEESLIIPSISNIRSRSYRNIASDFPEIKFTKHNGEYIVESSKICYIDRSKNIIVDVKFDINGNVLNFDDVKEDIVFGGKLYIFVNNRVSHIDRITPYLEKAKYIYVDNVDGEWQVLNADREVVRRTGKLIDTRRFESLQLEVNKKPVNSVQVYDPLKGIYLGEFDKNIDFKSETDPATYDGENPMPFGKDDVGKVWWDLSETKFIYYELPKSVNESESEILEYRRKNWGKIFPNSKVRFCVWVESNNPPEQYNGEGKPLDISKFNKVENYISSINSYDVKYYFWVYDTTNIPDGKTLSSVQLKNIIERPKLNNVSWFSPIMGNSESLSLCVYNTSNDLTNSACVIDLSYKISNEKGNIHNEWYIIRDNDRHSKIPDRLWDKFVSSIVGYTNALPAHDYSNGISISNNEVILPVPDINLKGFEKYGTSIRPQKTMFENAEEARRVVGEKLNSIIKGLKFFELKESNFSYDFSNTKILDKVDWVDERFESLPEYMYSLELENELSQYRNEFNDGDIIRIYPQDPSLDSLYKYYMYNKDEDIFELVVYQDGTYILNENFYNIDIKNVKDIHSFFGMLKNELLVRDDRNLQNVIFFTGIRYAFTESYDIDWVFKTSYVTIIQNLMINDNSETLSQNTLDSYISYFNEVKPYHTKIRQILTILSEILDIAIIDIVEFFEMNIELMFARHGNNANIYYDRDNNAGWDNQVYDWSYDKWDEKNPWYNKPILINDNGHEEIEPVTRGLLRTMTSDESKLTDVIKSQNTGEELVSISPNENIIIDIVDDIIIPNNDHWDVKDWEEGIWDSQKTNYDDFSVIAYRIHHSFYSKKPEHYVIPAYDLINGNRNYLCHIPIKVAEVNEETNYIAVDSNRRLSNHDKSLAWIGNELLSYDGYKTVSENMYVLNNVRRALKGTSKYPISVGDEFIVGIKIPQSVAYMVGEEGEGSEYKIYLGETKQPQYYVTPKDEYTTITNPWFFNLNLENLDETPPYSGNKYRRLLKSAGSRFLIDIDFCDGDPPPSPTIFIITTDKDVVTEGESVKVSITSNNFGTGKLEYIIVPLDSELTSDDFIDLPFIAEIDMVRNSASFIIDTFDDEIFESIESFIINVNIKGNSDIVATSDPISILDNEIPLEFTIEVSKENLPEGASLYVNARANKRYTGDVVFEIVNALGDLNASDLSLYSDMRETLESMVITKTMNNAWSVGFYLYTVEDLKTEGEEKLVINLNVDGETVDASEEVTIQDTSTDSTYEIYTFRKEMNETDLRTNNFRLMSNNMLDGEFIYTIVPVSGNFNIDDINLNNLTGNFRYTDGDFNSRYVALNVIEDFKTEGVESFKVEARKTGSDEVIATSEIITIQDTSTDSTYEIYTFRTEMNETDLRTNNFRLMSNNVLDGEFTYTIAPVSGNFNIEDISLTSLTGNFRYTDGDFNSRYITLNVIEDFKTEGVESFKIEARKTGSDEVIATSEIITIQDTTTDPTYNIVVFRPDMNETDLRTNSFILTSNNLLDGEFTYTIVPVSGDFNTEDISLNSLTGNFRYRSPSTKTYNAGITVIEDFKTEGVESFKIEARKTGSDEVIATSEIITVQDTSTDITYDITTSQAISKTPNILDESNDFIRVNLNSSVSTPDTFQYTIVPVSGDFNIEDISLNSLTGNFNRSSGVHSFFDIRTVEDFKTEGVESFKVEARKTGSDEVIATSEVITIQDTSKG